LLHASTRAQQTAKQHAHRNEVSRAAPHWRRRVRGHGRKIKHHATTRQQRPQNNTIAHGNTAARPPQAGAKTRPPSHPITRPPARTQPHRHPSSYLRGVVAWVERVATTHSDFSKFSKFKIGKEIKHRAARICNRGVALPKQPGPREAQQHPSPAASHDLHYHHARHATTLASLAHHRHAQHTTSLAPLALAPPSR